MIAVKKSQSILLFALLVYSSVLAWISSVHVDKVLAWLSFWKIYVLKANSGLSESFEVEGWIVKVSGQSRDILF